MSKKKDYAAAVPRFFIEDTTGNGIPITLPISQVTIRVGSKALFTEYDVTNVTPVKTELGDGMVFNFTGAAGRDLFRLTASNLGKRLVLTINGAPVGVRVIDRPFGDGSLFVYTELPEKEMSTLTEDLIKTVKDAQIELEKKK